MPNGEEAAIEEKRHRRNERSSSSRFATGGRPIRRKIARSRPSDRLVSLQDLADDGRRNRRGMRASENDEWNVF